MGVYCSNCCATADEQKNELSDDYGKMIINQGTIDVHKPKNISPDRKVRSHPFFVLTQYERLVKSRSSEK